MSTNILTQNHELKIDYHYVENCVSEVGTKEEWNRIFYNSNGHKYIVQYFKYSKN